MKQTEKLSWTRFLGWTGGIVIGLALLFMLVTNVRLAGLKHIPTPTDHAAAFVPGADDLTATPTGRDYSTTQVSEHGLFRVSYTSSQNIVPVNQMHKWTLHVETTDGQPVENAVVTVDGDMPEHGHGLPTRPKVTEYLGDGDYLVEGMKFQMGGWWVMDFTITVNDDTDSVHFNLKLD
jgi:hypothetical protein